MALWIPTLLKTSGSHFVYGGCKLEGWVKFHRKILEWEWYECDLTFKLYFTIVLLANHKDKKWQGMEIKRGQLLTGRKVLAEKLKTTEQRIRTSLNRLISTNNLTIKTTNKHSIITVSNYDEYQSINQQPNQQTTNKQPTNNQQITTTKNVKKEENVKNDKNKNKLLCVGNTKNDIFDRYNDFVKKVGNEFKSNLKPLKILSEERKNKISKAKKQGLNEDMFIDILNRALESNFITDNTFFNFDWLFRVRNAQGNTVCNWLDLYERKYENKVTKQNFIQKLIKD